jgi:hypothetical protein
MKFDKHYQRRYRKKNHAAARDYERSYIARLKQEVFEHYCKGKLRCQCRGCPIRHIDLLSIDHIKPVKVKLKRSKKTGYVWRADKHGWNLWAWLRTHGYPNGFQVLCLACNKAKSRKAHCPRYGKRH